jgi:hypothetical protein
MKEAVGEKMVDLIGNDAILPLSGVPRRDNGLERGDIVAVDMSRFLCCLTAHDFACRDHVMIKNGHIRKADAVRYAIAEQVKRSKASDAVQRYSGIAFGCREINASNGDGTILKRWHMLRSPGMEENLHYLVERHGLKHQSEAMRFALRAQAYADGMPEPPPEEDAVEVPAPKPKKKRVRRKKSAAAE